MKRITKNLLAHWRYLGGVLLLFLIQIYCITGITNAVYGMRSTGAQKSGIEYMVSEALVAGTWKNVELYMSDSEKTEWSNAYEKGEDGFYYLKESVKGGSSLNDLEQKFMIPQAIAGKLSQMKKKDVQALMGDKDSPFAVDYMEIRDMLEEELEAEGVDQIRRYALEFVREQSKAAGVDLQKKTTQYIWGAVFRIAGYGILIAGTVAGMIYLTGIMERVIGRWVDEPEVRQAQQMFAYAFCIMVYAVFFYGSSFFELARKHAGMGWYLAGVVLGLAGLAGVWLLRTRPELEQIYRTVSWDSPVRRQYIKRLNLGIVAVIPGAALCISLTAACSPALAYLFLLFLADGMLVIGAFLLLEIVAAVDCVEGAYLGVNKRDE